MNTPFSDYTRPHAAGSASFETPFQLEGPLLNPEQIAEAALPEAPYGLPDPLQGEYDPVYEMVEHQVPPGISTFKIGGAALTVADTATALSPHYLEPVISGNPLLIITPGDRRTKISKNFLVGEFTAAQSGNFKFDFARIDPSLVENLQRLRSFLEKPIDIIDGYYSPRYLKEQLKITDPLAISRNPHIQGRGVKMAVAGYKGMVKQLAIAALVTCDNNINISIGESTMTLAVKQPLKDPVSIKPEDFQRITAYISDEKTKVTTAAFCVEFKRLFYHSDSFQIDSDYARQMRRAVSAFTVAILKTYYPQNTVPADWYDWETPLRRLISVMYGKGITKNPNVILYCLAYSPFGNLYRYFFKDRSDSSKVTVDAIINELTTDRDRQVSNTPGNFIPVQQYPDKTTFIDYCRQRLLVGRKPDGSGYHLVPATFFDWKDNAKDKSFLDRINGIILDEFFRNRYESDIPVQQSPEGGTSSNLKLSVPNPDKPVNDFTGRYWVDFTADQPELHGRYFIINQAGNYISGKFGGIYKSPVRSLRKTITEFYGKVDEKGNAICHLFPQQTLILKKDKTQTRVYIIDNTADKLLVSLPLTLRSKNPVFSNNIVDAFSKINPGKEELLLTLAWVQPTPAQLKTFFESFIKTEREVKEAITKYYHENESMLSVRKTKLSGYVSALSSATNNFLKLPPMFRQFASYYTLFYYSALPHWSPAGDRETMSPLNWIKKMLEDYRDVEGTAYIEQRFKGLYDFFHVDTHIPAVLYQYAITIKLSSWGFGPFARSHGTITIENKTDYTRYPKADRWHASKNKEDFPIVLWNATLSLNPGKWLPKIAAGQTIEAATTTDAFYQASDFSGADVQVTEGKVVELPININMGGTKVTTKAGIGGVVILVDGRGKKTLEFIKDLELGLPDTIEIEPSDPSAKEGTFEKIAGFLPSLTMYKGSIDTKETLTDVVSIPLPEKFDTNYQIQNTRYFKHDDATLSLQAIEAVGRLCSEELVAFSDVNTQVEIYGHTDASGKPDYNIKLSEARAANVWQAIKDRLGYKLKAKLKIIKGLGEEDANKKFGQFTEKNAWLRRVVVIINGRAVLSLGEL